MCQLYWYRESRNSWSSGWRRHECKRVRNTCRSHHKYLKIISRHYWLRIHIQLQIHNTLWYKMARIDMDIFPFNSCNWAGFYSIRRQKTFPRHLFNFPGLKELGQQDSRQDWVHRVEINLQRFWRRNQFLQIEHPSFGSNPLWEDK